MGDDAAFEILVRRWEAPLYRFLRRITGSAVLAEDARQLTLVRILQRAETYRGGSVSVWIYRVAYHIGIDVRRRESRGSARSPLVAGKTVVGETAAGETAVGKAGAHQRVDRSPSPAVAAETRERDDRVRRALDRLDHADRALVWLRVAEGLSFEQVARVTGEPRSSLRYRFLRALRRLRKHLGTPVDCGLDA